MDRVRDGSGRASPRKPPGFEVSVSAVPVPTRSGDPYRTAPEPAPLPRLTIRWRPDGRWWLVLASSLWWALILLFLLGRQFGLVIPFTPIGVWLLRDTLVAMNWSYVRVDSEVVVWSSEPFPLRRQIRIEISDIDQLFAAWKAELTRSGQKLHFWVKVRTRSGEERVLAKLGTPSQARWLAHAIERHLGIEDRTVEGELG